MVVNNNKVGDPKYVFNRYQERLWKVNADRGKLKLTGGLEFTLTLIPAGFFLVRFFYRAVYTGEATYHEPPLLTERKEYTTKVLLVDISFVPSKLLRPIYYITVGNVSIQCNGIFYVAKDQFITLVFSALTNRKLAKRKLRFKALLEKYEPREVIYPVQIPQEKILWRTVEEIIYTLPIPASWDVLTQLVNRELIAWLPYRLLLDRIIPDLALSERLFNTRLLTLLSDTELLTQVNRLRTWTS